MEGDFCAVLFGKEMVTFPAVFTDFYLWAYFRMGLFSDGPIIIVFNLRQGVGIIFVKGFLEFKLECFRTLLECLPRPRA